MECFATPRMVTSIFTVFCLVRKRSQLNSPSFVAAAIFFPPTVGPTGFLPKLRRATNLRTITRDSDRDGYHSSLRAQHSFPPIDMEALRREYRTLSADSALSNSQAP